MLISEETKITQFTNEVNKKIQIQFPEVHAFLTANMCFFLKHKHNKQSQTTYNLHGF